MTRARALGIVLALAFTACSPVHGGSGGRHPWTDPDRVRIGFYEEPDTLDPVITSMTFSDDAFQLLFDGLVRFDDRGRAVPDLATAVPTLANGGISRDGKSITYHLVRNARWSDGVPVTSADVAFTWRAIMNPANDTPQRTGYDRIARIDTPDPYTVVLRFRSVYPPAVDLFEDGPQGAIVPAHVLAKAHDLNRLAFNASPVGSGPYVLAKWTHGSTMSFVANPHYFRGAPAISRVDLVFITNQNTLTGAMRSHQIDVDLDVPPLSALQLRGVGGVTLAQTSTTHWEHLTFNTSRPPLDDVTVRRALCMAIDERAIFRDYYHGYGLAAPTHFNPRFGWGDPAVRYLPFDPARAGAMLDAIGYRMGPGGIRSRHGTPLAFSITTVAGVKAREAIEVYLQSAWRAIGADATIHNASAAILFAPYAAGGLLPTGKTDVSLYTWEYLTPDPNEEQFTAPSMVPPAGENESFFRDPEVVPLERTALSTFDRSVRARAYRALSHVLIDRVPEYVLDWLPEIVAYDDDLVGPGPVPVGSDLWNVARWRYR